jgi:RNA polymerase sigma factor (sigma-70 family)
VQRTAGTPPEQPAAEQPRRLGSRTTRREDGGLEDDSVDDDQKRGRRAGRLAEDFTDFVRAASGSLLHTAWLLTGDRHRAEDLVQAALARTYVAWARVRRDDATAYARRVLVNLHTDWWRRWRWRQRPVDRLPDRQAADDGPTRADQRDALVRALARLGRRCPGVLTAGRASAPARPGRSRRSADRP